MNFIDNKKILKAFYEKQGLSKSFDSDCLYLEKSFNEISKIWFDNLNQIEKVNFVMIAEAPLWGKVKKYIYNPEINNSQFFYRSDLGDILNKTISNKKSFIKECNDIGLIVIDISPFALNPTDTSINYREMTINQYRELVNLTIPFFFEQKINGGQHDGQLQPIALEKGQRLFRFDLHFHHILFLNTPYAPGSRLKYKTKCF